MRMLLLSLKGANDSVQHEGEFDSMLHTVLADIPETWKQYPDTQDGRLGIMDMECKEFKQALMKNKDKAEIRKELMHVVAACYRLYEGLADE